MDSPDQPISNMSPTEVRALINTLETRNEELLDLVGDEIREAGEFGTAQLALEDIGWRPLSGIAKSANSFTLEGLHRASEMCRAVATINPLVERGLKVRTGYIWGSGVSVVPSEFITGPGRPRTVNTTPELPAGLSDVLTGALAQMEIEMSAATDGNLFFLVDKKAKTVQRIPFEEISEGVSQRGNRERLMYIRRTWNDWDLELDPSEEIDIQPFTKPKKSRSKPKFNYQSVWYPTPAAMEGRRDLRSGAIQNDPVDHSKVMVHIAFNRMVGWRWGVPDVLPAIWWTKAYKEYLENCATLTKAYARFAWKVTNEKSKGVRRTAATLAQAPRTDPATGQPLSVGASAVLGAGQDLAAVGNKSAVDFDAGRPLAAMIAAALDVPLPALTEDPTIGNRAGSTSLDTSTTLVMQARQKVMDETFQLIFRMLGLKVRLRWPEIAEEPIHRRLQAIDMAVRMGVLSDREARSMVLDAWHDKWDDFPADPPKEKDLPHPMKPKEDLESGASSGGTGGPGAPSPLKTGSRTGGRPPKQPDPMSMGDHGLRDESSGNSE
ncbi:hypothetical protein [Streptomyces sp. 5-10]|uniref:hypothetical protein n=1 Tax=Streptomyces sp. 5-10 TaxID=878925 RepID=UPI00168A92C0|nr:hypothetical protein [Streptomyces sp. 5-10]MBD3004540.1 hypothetical protein [Streptomyces sp. 5-10]